MSHTFFLNYLPNIQGITIPGFKEALGALGYPNGTHSSWVMGTALQSMAAKGQAEQIEIANIDWTCLTQDKDVDYLPFDKMEVGDIIIMGNRDNRYVHVAIYAGTSSLGLHFVTHIGNSRGPEIAQIRDMASLSNGPGQSIPLAVYRLPVSPRSGSNISSKETSSNGGAVAGYTAPVGTGRHDILYVYAEATRSELY